jgi:hypothetical protein
MQGQSDAATHDEYIERLGEPRRSDIRALHELLRTAAANPPGVLATA